MLNIRATGRSRLLTICLIVFAASVSATGCGEDDGSSTPVPASTDPTGAPGAVSEAAVTGPGSPSAEFVDEPPPIQIATGSQSGYHVDEPTVVVAQNQGQMNAIARRHFSNGVEKEDIVPVSFNQDRQLVALFMPVSAKGALVSIQGVSYNGDAVKVSATMVLPGKGCKVSGSRTRPFSWVETRKLSGDVEVDVERIKSSAC